MPLYALVLKQYKVSKYYIKNNIPFRSQKTVYSDITINVSEMDKISKLKVMSITDTGCDRK